MDLGTANTIIISDDKIVVDEPSVVALDRRTDKMIAVGQMAKMMYEKTHDNIRTIRPLRDGVIADFSACEQMMRGLIKMVHTGHHFFSPSLRMVIGVPSGSTEVELRAVRDSAEHADGRDVYLIFEPMAAAIGIGIDVEAPEGHMVIDIGGGTSNLALCRDGQVVATGCLNVGGRLLKFTENGEITYISPVLKDLVSYRAGDTITQNEGMEVAKMLASALEMAASLRDKDGLYQKLLTPEARELHTPENVVLSFSGGVADCIEKDVPWLSYGDLGPLLGKAIRDSRLCRGSYRLGSHTIRATVIGAGCHSTQLSGSTVFLQNVQLPLQNLPVAVISAQEQEGQLQDLIRQRLENLEQWGVLALPGWNAPSYARVTALADAIAQAVGNKPCYIALQEDMAKALGHALALRLPPGTPCLCVDRVHIPADSYLDVGSPVGPAISLVVKTLIYGGSK